MYISSENSLPNILSAKIQTIVHHFCDRRSGQSGSCRGKGLAESCFPDVSHLSPHLFYYSYRKLDEDITFLSALE